MAKRAKTKTVRAKAPESQQHEADAVAWARRILAKAASTVPSAVPPGRLAPSAIPPVAQNEHKATLAPWPLSDRFPLVLGSQLDLNYVASTFRLATTGYRLQYVDLLNELLELDPHLFSVLSKRILSVAKGKLEITAFDVPEDDPDFQLAQDAAELVQREMRNIRDLVKSLASLLWGTYYGISCSEIFWSRDGDGWHPERLEFVHSRRLQYPDGQSWDLRIWDQGQVFGWSAPWGSAKTNDGIWGLRLQDYPGKFVVHTPQLRGEYPTRDGLGREVAVWALLKRIGGRGASAYLERFAKGFMDVSFNTGDPDMRGLPRAASDEDIALAHQIGAAIGPGSGSYSVHPDSIKLEPKGYEGAGRPKITWSEWIWMCDAQMSKAVLGGTLGTEVGATGGSYSLGEVQERAEADLELYDAVCLAETLRRDLVSWIVRLNMPEAMHLVPNVTLHLETDPDPKAIVELIDKLTLNGAPVDLDKMCSDIGISLVPNENKDDKGKPKPRASFRMDVTPPTQVFPDLLSEEAKQQQADDKAAQQEIAKIKAQAPVAPPGQAPDDAAAKPAADQDKAKAVKPSAKKAAPAAKQDAKGKKADANTATKVDKAEAKKASKAKKLTDRIVAGEEDALLESGHRMLLSDDSFPVQGRGVAQAVYDDLVEDYPANALGWILAAQWRGPEEVPAHEIDFSKQNHWRVTKELRDDPNALQPYMNRINRGKRKPVVLVKTPGNPLYEIVDGHHRSVAQKMMEMPVRAYIANVQVDAGPWETLHSLQGRGSSKSSYMLEPASWLETDEIDDDP